MKIKKIFYTSHFRRAFKRLPRELKDEILAREKLFHTNCFDKRLKTHKLAGQLKQYWAFSITSSHRIMFEIIKDGVVAFIDVGNHSIYK